MTKFVINSYFETLTPLVLDVVVSFQSDFTEHDKKSLEGYEGEFILGCRPTGTYLFKLNNSPEMMDYWKNFFIETNKSTGRSLRQMFIDSFYYQSIVGVIGNKHFIHGFNKTVQTVSKQDAERIMMNFFETKLYPVFRGLKYEYWGQWATIH